MTIVGILDYLPLSINYAAFALLNREGWWSALLRHAFVIVLVGVLGILAAAPAAARSGADVSVELDATAGLLLPSVQYKVSVTNTGPSALTSATVVVHLDPRVSGAFNQPPPCPLDIAAATLTCSFGPLAPGATAAKTSWVVFTLPPAATEVDATATRTASAPADMNPANDSSSADCWYSNHYPGFPPYPYKVFC